MKKIPKIEDVKQIKDIVTNTTTYGECYIRDQELAGRILIDDENNFEGVVFNEGNSFLVIGSFNKDNIVMIQKDEDYDRLYKVVKDDDTYYGDCFIKKESFEYPIGECIMSIKDLEEYRIPYTFDEIREIESQIKSKKKTKNK